jgi:CHAT domain-containing protein
MIVSTRAPTGGEAQRAAIRELSTRQEELEAELARKCEGIRKDRDSRRLSSSELAACLPEETVLVDLVAYDQLLDREAGEAGPSRWEKRYAAFLIRPGKRTERVDLGEAAPIDAAVERWREEVRSGGTAPSGSRLRELVWSPVESRVGSARTVLVSPAGALSRVPFAALPGAEEGRFLIDEHAFVTVPVPRLLPALLAEASSDEMDRESILLVGEVDYGAATRAPAEGLVASARAAPRDGLRGNWVPLDATRSEILAVRESFEGCFPAGVTRLLRRGEATEEAFRAAAGAHRWIHVATHGFFAPREVRSALADATRHDGAGPDRDRPVVGFHPGLLCGIVLAGANLPVEPGRDDGILTALEVASIDFSGTELVTLSACETGLGEVADGEGVLGLQRAFQVAGARSTLTSLWKVDDRATDRLMRLMYQRLWREDLSLAEAVRQAQLALMRDPVMSGRLSRGLAVEDGPDAPRTDRLPPLYWAGFALAGEWR